jgi:hypothetical protein
MVERIAKAIWEADKQTQMRSWDVTFNLRDLAIIFYVNILLRIVPWGLDKFSLAPTSCNERRHLKLSIKDNNFPWNAPCVRHMRNTPPVIYSLHERVRCPGSSLCAGTRELIAPECLRGETFEWKFLSPKEASTRVRLLVLLSVLINIKLINNYF